MSGSDISSGFNETDQTLEVLARQLEEFLAAWESSAEPPLLADFLPERKESRRLALSELIKIDLEYRWQERNLPKRIGEYLEEFPELAAEGVPADLVYEEYHIRRNCGFQVDRQEYLDQFPDQAHELECLLGLDQSYQSTSMFGGGAKHRLDEIEVGQELDDFELLARLGEGAFARVFLARQNSMQRLVALKVSADSGAEPQTLAQFDHDYIVRVFDQRLSEERRLRLLYMQYVPGGTLQDAVRLLRELEPAGRTGATLLNAVNQSLENRGEMRPTESEAIEKLKSMNWPEAVCWIGSRLAEALDYAHRRGVLHRDIKPANVLLSSEAIPKLADFNISFSTKLAGITPAAYFGGSLAYMSPEQLEASDPSHPREPDSLDGRSDLYSLGVVLWELLTGARPFADQPVDGGWSNLLSKMISRRRESLDADALRQLPEDCPPGLVRVLEICLAPEPDDRWSSGEEMSKQLALCRNRRVQDLLHPPPKSWKTRMGKWLVPCLIVVAGVPNALGGWLNYVFNENQLRDNLQEALGDFHHIQMVINSIAYPLGTLLMTGLTWYLHRGVKQMRRGESIEPGRLRRLRYHALYLGHSMALISVTLWTIAGIAYPVSIHLVSGTMNVYGYVHFFVSLLLCGLIAAAYPFFGATYFGQGVLYPGLLLDDLSASDDAANLRRLNRLAIWYLVIAATVPLLGILALVVFDVQYRWALGALSIGGLFGFGLLFWRCRVLQADLNVLIEALSPRA